MGGMLSNSTQTNKRKTKSPSCSPISSFILQIRNKSSLAEVSKKHKIVQFKHQKKKFKEKVVFQSDLFPFIANHYFYH